MAKRKKIEQHDDGEFLWLVSLSDLMILLFVFFVVLFSFSFQKMTAADLIEVVAMFNGEKKTPIDEVQEKLKSAVEEKGMADQIEISQKGGVLTISIKDTILFESGRSLLKPESNDVMAAIAEVIQKVPPPYRLGIEGHTDDVPFAGPRVGGAFADNWELSIRRASEVFYALHIGGSEIEKRTIIMGYGPMNPLVPNKNEQGEAIPENRAKNRRVTLKIF